MLKPLSFCLMQGIMSFHYRTQVSYVFPFPNLITNSPTPVILSLQYTVQENNVFTILNVTENAVT
jgi:hypothetical protein